MSVNYYPDDGELVLLTQQVAESLIAQKLSLVTAESCTGGWIAKCCTDLAGSSEWFDRGIVSYSNAAKQSMLAVPMDLINTFGAVSSEVAAAMAIGALNNSEANVALAVTGIAGPEGGSADKPVGSVWFGWAWYSQGDVLHKTKFEQFSGEREAVRRHTIKRALAGVLSF